MKYAVIGFLLLAIVLCAAFLPGEAPGGEYSPGSEDLSAVDRVELTNCHNGHRTILTDPGDIAAVTGFLQTVVGDHPESGKGYYEGSYALTLYRGKQEVLSLAFGDSDCFYRGKGPDGYPLRYPLRDMTIKGDVVPFFEKLDESGARWE